MVSPICARAIEGIWRILGLKNAPPMTRMAIDMLSATFSLNDQKARKDLGYRPVISLEAGMKGLTN